MLRLRPEQMAVFEVYMLGRFVERMCEHLRRDFSENVARMTDPELATFVRTSIEVAERYAIRFERDIRRYLDAAVENGLDPELSKGLKWTREILQAASVDGTAKMDRIEKGLAPKSEEEPDPSDGSAPSQGGDERAGP